MQIGINVFTFRFRWDSPPLGAMVDVGVGGVEEMLEGLDVWVYGDGMV